MDWYPIRWRLASAGRTIRRLPKVLFVYPWQRVTRGWSDRDSWDGGSYLAGIAADILNRYADTNTGTKSSYLYEVDPNLTLDAATNEDWDKANAIQVSQYRQHAAVLARYHEGADIYTDRMLEVMKMTEQEYLDKFGPGIHESEWKATMAWLGQNLEGMWD
jgi:hypothetical protein